MTPCDLDVLPTDTSPQFFYQSAATKRGENAAGFCLESTLHPGHFICVNDSQVCLRKTTTDDFMTHFTTDESPAVSVTVPALQNENPLRHHFLWTPRWHGDLFSGRSIFTRRYSSIPLDYSYHIPAHEPAVLYSI